MAQIETLLTYLSLTAIKIIAAISAITVTATTNPLPFWMGVIVGFITYVLMREGLIKLKKIYHT